MVTCWPSMACQVERLLPSDAHLLTAGSSATNIRTPATTPSTDPKALRRSSQANLSEARRAPVQQGSRRVGRSIEGKGMGVSLAEIEPSVAPDSTTSSGDQHAFANVGNLEHCVKYLNQTLAAYGFPSQLNLLSNEPNSVAQACNCIYAILQQRQRDIDYRESANDQRQRLVSDMSRLESKVERLEAQLSAKERELVTVMSREQKASASFKAQIEKLQLEKDEFQRMLIGSQQIRTQQLHELKKKEKEYLKLQERLNQVLMEKKKETKAGMEIMNLLQKEGRQRGTWNARKADGEFYKMIVDAYEAKKHELVAENTDLRSLLRAMQSDMRDFLNLPPQGSGTTPRASTSPGDMEPPATPLGGRTDVFDLPFHIARDQIEQSLRAKMSSIKERMLQLEDAHKSAEVTCEASERELELEAQLVEARSIIQEQASLMNNKHHPPHPSSE